MRHTPNPVHVLEQIAEAWNQAGVDYAVTHGLGRYPTGVGRDLDVMFTAQSVLKSLSIASQVLEDNGYSIAFPHPIWGRRVVGVHTTGAASSAIEIHGITSVGWSNVCFAGRPRPTEMTGPFRVDPWASFAKRVLLPLLAEGETTFDARPGDFCFASQAEAAAVRRELPRHLGQEDSAAIAGAVQLGQPRLLAGNLRAIRRRLRMKALCRQPGRSSARLFRVCTRRLWQFRAPCGPIIALLGPDGAGKTTAIAALQQSALTVFTRVTVRHWRPGLLPLRSSHANPGGGRTAPAGQPRPEAGHGAWRLWHWAKLLYYFADYQLGHALRDVWDSSRQRLIVYDRWASDMFVDPHRYGLASACGTLLLSRWVPRPDVIVLLTATPSEIYGRKQELTVPEIEAQLSRCERLSQLGLIDQKLDAGRRPAELAASLLSLALRAFVSKNQHVPEPHDG